MKRFRLIEIPSTTIDRDTNPVEWEADRVDYIACIQQILRQPAQSGSWLEDAERSLRVLDALEGKSLGDILELEDADHAHLCEKVRTARWAVVDRRLVQFSHTVLNATGDALDAFPAAKSNREPSFADHSTGTVPAPDRVVGKASRVRPRRKHDAPPKGRRAGA